MAVPDGLAHLPDDGHAVGEGELGALLEVPVEAFEGGVVFEDEAGSAGGAVGLEVDALEHVGVREGREDAGLAGGGALELILSLGGGRVGDEVHAHAADEVGDGLVAPEVVLVARLLVDDLVDDVADGEVAELAVPLALDDAEGLERADGLARGGEVDHPVFERRHGAFELPLGDGAGEGLAGDDAGAPLGVEAGDVGLVVGEQHERLDARPPPVELLLQQRRQRPRLAPRAGHGGLHDVGAVAVHDGVVPVDAVAGEASGVRLDLDEVERVVPEDERVDLVAPPVGLHQLDEAPQGVGVLVGEGRLDELDGLPLPGVRRVPVGEDAVAGESHGAPQRAVERARRASAAARSATVASSEIATTSTPAVASSSEGPSGATHRGARSSPRVSAARPAR